MDPETLRLAQEGVVYLVALVLSICVHEFGHAFVADRLGDRLPRAQGRVTLNPVAHVDTIGTLVLPIVAFVASIHSPAIGSRILGWGKPVQISLSPRDINRKISIRTAHALIAIAGPMMNILFALLLSAVMVLLVHTRHVPLASAVAQVILMNIGLCLFNLLPVPPLDGGAVLARLVPRSMDWLIDKLNQYGIYILFGLLMTGALSWMMYPAYVIGNYWIDTVLHWTVGS
jgi:Zn-dependent protease